MGFPGGSDGKEIACNAGDPGSIPEEIYPGEESDHPLQYSCLENSMDKGVCVYIYIYICLPFSLISCADGWGADVWMRSHHPYRGFPTWNHL